jgi:hypothetical protein
MGGVWRLFRGLSCGLIAPNLDHIIIYARSVGRGEFVVIGPATDKLLVCGRVDEWKAYTQASKDGYNGSNSAFCPIFFWHEDLAIVSVHHL